MSKLAPRTAIICFSIDQIYHYSEKIRQLYGGVAIVVGAFSPQTRNAQVELYESKEVNYLVATDAIGLGLNLNIEQIVFSSLQKFDGLKRRQLTPLELGQIAGRAGRYKSNGQFTTLSSSSELSRSVVSQITNHRYNSIDKIYWRNSALSFASPEELLLSLRMVPDVKNLSLSSARQDEIVFRYLYQKPEIASFIRQPSMLELLWQVCQIPEYRKISFYHHCNFLRKVFLQLAKDNFVSSKWFSRQLAELDRDFFDISSLSNALGSIRYYINISNHSGWLDNSEFWRDRTREIENNISVLLHEGLVRKYVNKAKRDYLSSSQGNSIEGIVLRSMFLSGFEWLSVLPSNLDSGGLDRETVIFIEAKFGYIRELKIACMTSPVKDFAIDSEGYLLYVDKSKAGNRVALLSRGKTAGASYFLPIVKIIEEGSFNGQEKSLINKHLSKVVRTLISTSLDTKIVMSASASLDALEKSSETSELYDFSGVLYLLAEWGGILPLDALLVNQGAKKEKAKKGGSKGTKKKAKLDKAFYKVAKKHYLWLGKEYCFINNIFKAEQRNLLLKLKLVHGDLNRFWVQDALNLQIYERASFSSDLLSDYSLSSEQRSLHYHWLGYVLKGELAVRINVYEKLLSKLLNSAMTLSSFEQEQQEWLALDAGSSEVKIPYAKDYGKKRHFVVIDGSFTSLLGCSWGMMDSALRHMGYFKVHG